MISRISQAQADDAAAEAARFWPELGRRWPWTRAPELAPVYRRAGELLVALLRAYPAIQWSNQALWYRRDVRDTPAIIVMSPTALRDELHALSPSAAANATDGKHVHTLIYLVESDADDATAHAPEAVPVAKTMLASTAVDAPFYIPQLTHELLNCFCHTDWDGHTLRSGLRRTVGVRTSEQTSGAALNDLLLDAILVHFLPAATALQPSDLFDGAQGPYWRIARTLSTRLRGVPALPALFSGEPDAVSRMEQGMVVALGTAEAAFQLDALAAAHDWAGLRGLLGDDY